MNKKQKKTLEDIIKQPVQANIAWKDIENLFKQSIVRYLKDQVLEFG